MHTRVKDVSSEPIYNLEFQICSVYGFQIDFELKQQYFIFLI